MIASIFAKHEEQSPASSGNVYLNRIGASTINPSPLLKVSDAVTGNVPFAAMPPNKVCAAMLRVKSFSSYANKIGA